MSRWRRHAETVRSIEGLKAFADRLSQAIGAVDRAAEWLLDTGRSEDERLVASAPFRSLVGPGTAAAYFAHGLARAAGVGRAVPCVGYEWCRERGCQDGGTTVGALNTK